MRLLLFGDKAEASKWIPFAKSKVSLLPELVDKTYNIGDTVIRIYKFPNLITRIEITSGQKLGYQFVVPFDYKAYDTDLRFNQTYITKVGASFKAATAYNVPYESTTGVPRTYPALKNAETAGTANYSTWWSSNGMYIHYPIPNRRHVTGAMAVSQVWFHEPWYLSTSPISYKEKGGVVKTLTTAGGVPLAVAKINSKFVYVAWSSYPSDTGGACFLLLVKQPAGWTQYQVNLPSWCNPDYDFLPHGFFNFSRDGTRLVCQIETLRTDSNSFYGYRNISGVVEYSVNWDEDGDPYFGLITDEHDEEGFTQYIAADYRWDTVNELPVDQLVIIKLQTRLQSSFVTTNFIGESSPYTGDNIEHNHKMVAVDAEWREVNNGSVQAPYRTKQVFHGPLIHLCRGEGSPGVWTTFHDNTTPGLFGVGTIGNSWEGAGTVISDDDIKNYFVGLYGYISKFSQFRAIDLRADAYVLAHIARVDDTFADFQQISASNTGYEYECFGESGYADIIKTRTASGWVNFGAPVPPYAEGSAYPVLSSTAGHPDNLRVHSLVNETIPSLFSVFNSIVDPVFAADHMHINAGFFAIHPDKHWSCYTEMPTRWWVGSTVSPLSNGYVGIESNSRLFDTIRVKQSDGSYTVTRHLEAAGVWGVIDEDGVIAEDVTAIVDGYLALATAGIWAV